MDWKTLQKYIHGNCSEQELRKLGEWLRESPANEDFFSSFIESYKHKEYSRIETDAQEAWKKFKKSKQTIREDDKDSGLFKLSSYGSEIKQRKGREYNYWYYAAAAIILIVSILFVGEQNTETVYNLEEAQEIVTAKGQRTNLELSDGSKIVLNAESKLLIPKKFDEFSRTIYLEGEAFFDVAEDFEHPFVVHTHESTVEVLGTKFNVKIDTARNNVQVAVLEGKVAFKKDGAGDMASVLLTRNNFGLLQLTNNRIIVEKMRAENHLSWARNRLVYDGETLEQVSQQLEYLYGIEIRFADQRLKSLSLTADIERTEFNEVVSIIAKTFEIRYTIKDQELIWQY